MSWSAPCLTQPEHFRHCIPMVESMVCHGTCHGAFNAVSHVKHVAMECPMGLGGLLPWHRPWRIQRRIHNLRYAICCGPRHVPRVKNGIHHDTYTISAVTWFTPWYIPQYTRSIGYAMQRTMEHPIALPMAIPKGMGYTMLRAIR